MGKTVGILGKVEKKEEKKGLIELALRELIIRKRNKRSVAKMIPSLLFHIV